MDGVLVDLTTAEFELLYLLARHAGQTLSRNDIYQEIHGMKYDGVDRSIDLRISRLRKKLGDDPARPKMGVGPSQDISGLSIERRRKLCADVQKTGIPAL